MKERYWLHSQKRIGCIGDPKKAVAADHPFEELKASDFYEVTEEEYDIVLDYRYEDGEWQQ